ncbi:hypothetical protein V8C34DRAFT_283559 [Trichoderma compactum]
MQANLYASIRVMSGEKLLVSGGHMAGRPRRPCATRSFDGKGEMCRSRVRRAPTACKHAAISGSVDAV